MKFPDETDRAIIARLQYDGRTPYTEIASELELSEASVRRRTKRLMDEGVLQIVGVAEPHFLGWNASGMIGVSVRAGEIDTVAEQIGAFPEVSYLFMASGGFDLFVEVFCRDIDHFVAFLNEKLQKVPDVERTETFMILKMYKISYHWGDSFPDDTARENESNVAEQIQS
ncbi:MAG: Lrp/AsnC family transcriptional regulator [Anaerolineales bacterium]